MFRSLSLLPILLLPACSMYLDDAPASNTPVTTYGCEGAVRISVSFPDQKAWVTNSAGKTYRLKQRPTGSGFSYEGDRAVLRGKGDVATWTPPDGPALECVGETP